MGNMGKKAFCTENLYLKKKKKKSLVIHEHLYKTIQPEMFFSYPDLTSQM